MGEGGRRVRRDGPAGRPGSEVLGGAAVSAVSVGLIALWVAWWVESLRRNYLVFGLQTWVPVMPGLAADFVCSIDHNARYWAAGFVPYRITADRFAVNFPYPPTMLRLFTWVSLFSVPGAVRVWLPALAGVLVAGAVGAWRSRRALGLTKLPLAAVVAAVLYSTPAVTALERGQCDPLAVLPMIAAAWLLRRGGGSELLAGGVLGAAAWLKYYPGAALLGLVALGRWRGAAAFVAVAALIGWHDRAEVVRVLENGQRLTAYYRTPHEVHPLSHTIPGEWPWLGVVRAFPPLGRVPGMVAAVVLLGPAVASVALRAFRARGDARLALPLFLWLTAAATFGMPSSNDYNLIFLPLAALACWDCRDPAVVHAALALLLAWWQPVALPVSGEAVFAVKLAGLYAVGACLARRAGECAGTGLPSGRQPRALTSSPAAGSAGAGAGSSRPSTPAQRRS